MTHKKILKLLTDSGISFVVIGGTALRIYNSPRVTHDIDISIPVLQVDSAVELFYDRGYYLVTDVDGSACFIAQSSEEALLWIENEKAGAVSFISLQEKPSRPAITHAEIDVSTQIDLIFEPEIPFTLLKKNAVPVDLGDFSFLIASAEDLLTMKENRSDSTEADEEDIRFLRRLLKK